MGFETNIPSHVLIGDEDVIFGTVELSDAYGEVRSATLNRTADQVEVENAVGGLKALILSKPRMEFDLEVLVDSSLALPGLGDPIAYPFVGIVGRIISDISIKWSNKEAKMLSFKACHWDSMAEETSPGSGIYHNPAYIVDLEGNTTPIA